ncbi:MULTISPECIES: glycerol-3-phosphate acyltransferase [Dehalococcoides]|uniref:Glycerol-3-phosphate acyltransferase 1 n=2 Tax=Dehalococcoides mccartyi TaxID=61435 RepID=PLSY1_DEHM1|nr:glycerol-3-phosphate acyltransferase [Dehalococcoides mccartyi]Q3ZAI6.1 RecName: Full=Glycerol-3-phosphate acyltransferase 1; AltName: Full=Acyl-PO4 G3P acyltransferase 1; AltName: Full=Acyl-phosphate--glycerol-3-phosphate acyltransferase 1; AltName: Full=G3P acyltransferase 1; Short=GPAT 1; AltName: Full=Lysophosphatidic acid synthase 1; Short=LPA synthase 1 [Dehalococcoides mccartyi 195]AAW39177.1 membrane protein, putative [Dehalococcoides mccartyi 195]WRO08101.1 glycerol-3-phosphate acylt
MSLLIGYFLGSIPSAYLVTRRLTGRDIRQMGGGNMGGLNTFREVGVGAGAAVVLMDLAKGALAVSVAYYLLIQNAQWVILTGFAAVIGHNWPIWLDFKGGKGLGPAFGAMLFLLPVYGLPQHLLILALLVFIPLAITRNIALATGIALFSLPFLVWYGSHSEFATLISVLLFLMIGIKFVLDNRKNLRDPANRRNLIVDHWKRPDKNS